MSQCPSCGGDCGRTARSGCQYADINMSTVTLPRAVVETLLYDLKRAYINYPLAPFLRTAMETRTERTSK